MIIIAEKITIHYCGKKNKLLSNEVFKNPKKVLLFILTIYLKELQDESFYSLILN